MKKKELSNQRAYPQLPSALADIPWIVNGSVVAVSPKTESANTTYVWTRKIKARTVTQALTKEQYDAFRQAIEANRRVEDALKQMRHLSEVTLLNSLPGVAKKPRKATVRKIKKSPSSPS